jgi:hypothetical protein
MHSSLVRLQRAERMFGLSRGTFVCPGARLLFWARSPMRSCRTCPPVKTSCVAGKKSGPRNAHERVSVAAVIVDRRLPSVSVSLSHLAQKCAHAANQHLALDAETLFARRFCCHLHPHSPLVTARHNSNQREWLSQSVCASQHATFNLMLPRPLPIHSVQAIPMPADLGVFCLCLIARCSALELSQQEIISSFLSCAPWRPVDLVFCGTSFFLVPIFTSFFLGICVLEKHEILQKTSFCF